MSNPTDTGPAESDDGFDALDHRVLSVMSRLQCVVEVFGDWEGMQNELHPAAFVLKETTDDVVKLYEDLHNWHYDYQHTSKAKKVQS